MPNELNEQQIACKAVVDAIEQAFESGCGVAALAFAIEDAHCGLASLLHHLAQRMYFDSYGLLKARCIEAGAERVADGMGLTLNGYIQFLTEDAQREYQI